MPRLTLQDEFAQNGIGKMLSPEGYARAWEDQQQWLLGRLNSLISDSAQANTPIRTLITTTSREPSLAPIFNNASLAHNNHHFFASLSNSPAAPSAPFTNEVSKSFSSLDSLRATFIAHANAMFGPGFTWLVARRENYYAGLPTLALLNTYNAGTPYPEAHWRAQTQDMNTARQSQMSKAAQSPQVYAQEQQARGAAGYGLHSSQQGLNLQQQTQTAGSGNKQIAPGGQSLDVLLCVNTWEHVWLHDHGIGGKRRFLEAWWDSIDWRVVESRWSQVSAGRSAQIETGAEPAGQSRANRSGLMGNTGGSGQRRREVWT